jgi:predicted Holliday junction resolvase-like endonuclease
MKTPGSIQSVLQLLSSDKHLIAQCPNPDCNEAFPLSEAGLFYGEDFSPDALTFIKLQQEALQKTRNELKKMREMATKGAAKKSTEVNFGKVLEKIAPALEGFPFQSTDCRPIFEPIDYLAFTGWSKNGRVQELCFIDIKTGNAKLNTHQKQVKDAVEKGKVELQLY